MRGYTYDRRAREDVPIKVLEFIRIGRPGVEEELFLVERQGTFYTLYYSGGTNLSLGISARSKSKSRAKSDYNRLADKTLKGVQMMGGGGAGAEITATRLDSEAKNHLRAFDSPLVSMDWSKGDELGSPQEDFLPYIQKQLRDWKGSSNQLSATNHEYWPEFHAMIVEAVRKKYGSSITAYRGIYRDQAKDILENPGKPIQMRWGSDGYTSFADSLDGAKAYRGDKYDHWVVIKAVFRPKDIAMAPVMLPGFIEPDILMPLASDVYHSGDEFVVGPRKVLKHYRVVLKTKKPL